MNGIEKIEELNSFCKGSLSICYYTEWELSSYGSHTLFSYEAKIGLIKGKSLQRLVDYAYELYKEETKK